jgi:mannosyltransferase OCH1-like enzyme
MGSVPEHPFIEELIELLPASIKEHGSADPAVSTGPGHITRALTAWDTTGHDPVTLFPASYFYPYSWKEKYRRFERFEEAYAVHHWAGSWMQSSDSRLKQLAMSGLMRSWLTRRVFYVNAWIKARAARSA